MPPSSPGATPHLTLGLPPSSSRKLGMENWARSIELDMRTIATALEYVHKGQLQPPS